MPDLEAIHQRGDQRVITVCVDAEAGGTSVQGILERAGVSFSSFSGVPGEDEEAAASQDGAWGLADLADLDRLTLPTTLFITPDGRVDSIVRGALK